MTFKVPEIYRVKSGPYGTDKRDGNNGAFSVRVNASKRNVFCIASDGAEWEHVSVSIPGLPRPPNWAVMCEVKDLFWGPEDVVIQYHPIDKDYINFHPNCLHLWRKLGTNNFVETPPPWLIGPKQQ